MNELETAAGGEKIPLPSGGWAILRDPKTMRSRDKKNLLRGVKGKPDADNPVGFAVDLTDALITYMITEWHIPYGGDWAIPALCIAFDPQTGGAVVLDDLEIPDYDALTDAVKPAQELLFPDPVTPDDHDKPESPTPPAAE
jgi:hypothetical protein